MRHGGTEFCQVDLFSVVSCPNVVEFKLNVHSRSLRHSKLFHVEHRTYYGFYNPYNRIFITANNAHCLIDVFNHSFPSLLGISL